MNAPIFTASLNGNLALLKSLLSDGIDPNTKNENGYTPLMAASHDGRLSCAQLLIAAGAKVNEVESSGRTALINAVQHSTVAMVEFLLDNGAKVNLATNLGHTPLMHVPFNNYSTTDSVELASLLIRHGAKRSVKENSGKTTFDFAKEKGINELYEILSTIQA